MSNTNTQSESDGSRSASVAAKSAISTIVNAQKETEIKTLISTSRLDWAEEMDEEEEVHIKPLSYSDAVAPVRDRIGIPTTNARIEPEVEVSAPIAATIQPKARAPKAPKDSSVSKSNPWASRSRRRAEEVNTPCTTGLHASKTRRAPVDAKSNPSKRRAPSTKKNIAASGKTPVAPSTPAVPVVLQDSTPPAYNPWAIDRKQSTVIPLVSIMDSESRIPKNSSAAAARQSQTDCKRRREGSADKRPTKPKATTAAPHPCPKPVVLVDSTGPLKPNPWVSGPNAAVTPLTTIIETEKKTPKAATSGAPAAPQPQGDDLTPHKQQVLVANNKIVDKPEVAPAVTPSNAPKTPQVSIPVKPVSQAKLVKQFSAVSPSPRPRAGQVKPVIPRSFERVIVTTPPPSEAQLPSSETSREIGESKTVADTPPLSPSITTSSFESEYKSQASETSIGTEESMTVADTPPPTISTSSFKFSAEVPSFVPGACTTTPPVVSSSFTFSAETSPFIPSGHVAPGVSSSSSFKFSAECTPFVSGGLMDHLPLEELRQERDRLNDILERRGLIRDIETRIARLALRDLLMPTASSVPCQW